MMHFLGGNNTGKKTLSYKYTGNKPTDLRLPFGLEDGYQLWNWRNERLVTWLMFCTIVLQTLQCSVRLFYKLNVCSVRSIITWMWFCSLWLTKIRLFYERMLQAPLLLEATLTTEKVLYW